MKRLFKHPSLEDDNRYKLEKDKFFINTKRIVCPECNGYGTHTRRDIDETKLVDSMLEDGDYEGIKSYKNGAYDRICTCCNGQNVIDEYCYNELPEWAVKVIDDWNEEERQDRLYAEKERRFGA